MQLMSSQEGCNRLAGRVNCHPSAQKHDVAEQRFVFKRDANSAIWYTLHACNTQNSRNRIQVMFSQEGCKRLAG
jgi:hypothetical protein